jgi:hypothetical protein
MSTAWEAIWRDGTPQGAIYRANRREPLSVDPRAFVQADGAGLVAG